MSFNPINKPQIDLTLNKLSQFNSYDNSILTLISNNTLIITLQLSQLYSVNLYNNYLVWDIQRLHTFKTLLNIIFRRILITRKLKVKPIFRRNILKVFKKTKLSRTFNLKPLEVKLSSTTYNVHPFFQQYKKFFKNKYFKLFNPFVKIRNSRKFAFFQKKNLTKKLIFRKNFYKIKYNRRFWFISLILNLKKKIKIVNCKRHIKDSYMRFLRLDLFPKKRKVISKNTRRTYLTPKQILFLNIYKNRIKGTKNKPIKTLILRRVLKFYKRRLYKIKYRKFSSRLTKKIFKFKLKRLLNIRFTRKIVVKTLSSTSLTKYLNKPFLKTNVFYRSRRKMILKRRHLTTMFRYYRFASSSKKWFKLSLYLKKSRIRFFAWRFRRITLRCSKNIRLNKIILTNSKLFSKKLLKSPLNRFTDKISFKRSSLIYPLTRKSLKYRLKPLLNAKSKSTVGLTKFQLKIFYRKSIWNLKGFNRRLFKKLGKLVCRSFRSNKTSFLRRGRHLLTRRAKNKVNFKFNTLVVNLSAKIKATQNLDLFYNQNFKYKTNPLSAKRKFKNYFFKSVKNYFKRNFQKLTPLSKKSFKTLKYNTILSDPNSLYFSKTIVTGKLNPSRFILSQRKKLLSPFKSKIRSFIGRTFFNFKKKLSISTKHRTNFILSNLGFLFIQRFDKALKSRLRAKVRKYKFSFFYLKDIKRFFLKKPNRFKFLTSALFKPFSQRLRHFSVGVIKTSDNTDTFLNYNSRSNFLVQASKLEAYASREKFKYSKYFNTFNRGRVRIKRIKFKPGYSRIWRNARKALNLTLNLNFRYQYRLTRFLAKVSRIRNNSHIFINELTLLKLLFNSHFVTDLQFSKLLIESNLVFVNGLNTNNSNLNLFLGDFIQIIVNLKYYIVYRWMLNWNKYKRIRLTKLSRTKFRRRNIFKNKQRSYNLPDWILSSRIRLFDIPKYLEVDFFTLSTFIIYEPLSLHDFNPLNFVDSKNEVLNMYNWKYIN